MSVGLSMINIYDIKTIEYRFPVLPEVTITSLFEIGHPIEFSFFISLNNFKQLS